MTDKNDITLKPSSSEDQVVVQLLNNQNLKITTTLFNGQNYLAWSQTLIITLKSIGKMGYVDGGIKALEPANAGYKQ